MPRWVSLDSKTNLGCADQDTYSQLFFGRNVSSINPSAPPPHLMINLNSSLKYLYLMFTEEDLIPLDKYVFNTEGHPFTIFEWTEQERTDWGIPR